MNTWKTIKESTEADLRLEQGNGSFGGGVLLLIFIDFWGVIQC